MKFRIQTNGDMFRVQRRHWYGWGWSAKRVVENRVNGQMTIRYCMRLDSRDAALEWIRTRYGPEAEIVREWRTV